MLDKIKDIRAAINNQTYISALALALTLPDICSQIENGTTEGSRSQYIQWVDAHMDDESFNFPISGFETQNFKGNMCYSLRCKVLHNGTLDVKNQRLGVSVDQFMLTKPGCSNYYYGYQYQTTNNINKTIIAIDYLCEQLCKAAEDFYNSYEDKTPFEEHTFSL